MHLDESLAGKGVVGEGVEGGEAIKGVFGGNPDLEGESKDRKTSNGGVGVDNVECGVGKVWRAKIVVELMTPRRCLKTRSDEAKLAKSQVAVTSVRREAASEEACGETTRDWVAG